MKRALVFAATTVAFACGGPESAVDPVAGEENGAVEEVLDGKADTVVRPIGTFRGSVGAGQFSTLVLMTDKTFHAETMIYCITTPCNPLSTNGRYYYWRNSWGTRFVYLGSLGSYAYKYDQAAGALKLRKINTSTWFKLTAGSPAWCADAGDCEAQNLIHPMCAIGPYGGWKCNSGACGYSCGGYTDPCASVRCAAGTYCSSLNGTAECLAYNTCANVRCMSGYHCEDLPIVCVRAPCPPTAPSCVPN